MGVLAIIGAQWGDEGKGKVVDELGARADYVVRYEGGGTTVHRVVRDDREYGFRLVPSGILHEGTVCVIGNGVVVDPRALLAEMDGLRAQGVDLGRLYVSERAHVVMPYHYILEQLDEENWGPDAPAGPMPRGVGPATVDKYSRTGIRMADLLDVDLFRGKLASVLRQKNRMLTQIYGQEPLSLEEIHTEYFGYVQRLRPHIGDTQTMLQEALLQGRSITLEGAQGALLDVDFGTYPFVTPSSTVVAHASTGAGLPPRSIEHVAGIYKAYITRVGSGPMPTELIDGDGATLRTQGREITATTGRPRRCGWFDAVLGRFVAQLNGLDSAAIMKLDVLDTFATVKICTSYRLGQRELHAPPANPAEMAACEPVYEEWPGWRRSTAGATSWSDLPEQARRYLRRLEELLETPLALVSVGPGRGQTVHLRALPL
jgi:adenylosuccinate synthase